MPSHFGWGVGEKLESKRRIASLEMIQLEAFFADRINFPISMWDSSISVAF